jgi:hypothetical protein
MYRKGLNRLATLDPVKHAWPIPRETLKFFLHTITDPFLRALTWICWKTASRWDEIALLTKQSVKQTTIGQKTAIVIDWWINTKSSQDQPHRDSRFAVVVEHVTIAPKWETLSAYFSRITGRRFRIQPSFIGISNGFTLKHPNIHSKEGR